jgi:hypothetical protein
MRTITVTRARFRQPAVFFVPLLVLALMSYVVRTLTRPVTEAP